MGAPAKKKRTPVPPAKKVRTPVLVRPADMLVPVPRPPPRELEKGEKAPKVPLDAYYTPDWTVAQCLDEVLPTVLWQGDERPWRIVEPAAGAGAFVGPLRERYPKAHITALDLDVHTGPWPGADVSERGDFLKWTPPDNERVDLVIGNPPFGLAMDFVKHARDVSSKVVLLLRQGFLSSAERCAFFRSDAGRPLVVYQLANRPIYSNPVYVNRHADNAEYVFVVWNPNWQPASTTGLRWLQDVPANVRRPK